MGHCARSAAVGPERELSVRESNRAGFTLLGDFFKRMLDELYDGVYFVDVERRILYWNAAAERISGYSAAEVVGRCCSENILEHADVNGCILCQHACPLVVSIRTRKAVCKRVFLRHRMGHRLAVEVRTSPVADDRGRVIGAVEVFRDAGAEIALESAYRQARDLAAKDPLTGLANRRFLTSFVAEQLAVGSRADRRFALILVDVDHFKAINDSMGHLVGDQVLSEVGRIILSSCRESDIAGRFGGDEFALVLPGTPLDRAAGIADRMRAEICCGRFDAVGGARPVTASLGVAGSRPEDDWGTLFARADSALYEAKRAGRNCVCLSDPKPNRSIGGIENLPVEFRILPHLVVDRRP